MRGDYAGAEANFNLVIYKVEGDLIDEPQTVWVPSEYKTYRQDTAAHQRVRDDFKSLVPSEQRKWITEYVIFTDKTYDTLAWISRVDYDDNGHWKLGVDAIDSVNPVMLTETLTHELGQLVALQITRKELMGYSSYQSPTICPQYPSENGYSTPKSYIYQFYHKFWVHIHDDWPESVYASHTNDQDEFFLIVQQFHGKYPDQFVRAYAATNIREDMAVTFESFILAPKPAGKEMVE